MQLGATTPSFDLEKEIDATYPTEHIFLGTMLQAARGFGRNDVYAVASFLSASLYVTFNVVFIAVLHMGAVGMFMGMIVSNIISIGYLFFSLKYYKYYDIQRFDKILFKHMISSCV